MPVLARVVATEGAPLLEIGGRLFVASGAVPARAGESFEASVLSRGAGGLTLGVGGGLAVREAGAAAALAALGVAHTPEAEAALSATLASGLPVSSASLARVAAEAARHAALLGAENLREIVFLMLNRLPVNGTTVRLASLHLAGAAARPLAGDLAVALAALARLFPGFRPERLAVDPRRADGEALRGIVSLFHGAQDGFDLAGLLRSLGLLESDDLPESAVRMAAETADRLDAAAFASRLAAGRLFLRLPLSFDGELLDLTVEHRADGPDRHHFTLSADLPALGPVRAALSLFRKNLTVRVYATTAAARRSLESGAGELSAALSARGYGGASVAVHLADPAAIPVAPPAAGVPVAPRAVDVRA